MTSRLTIIVAAFVLLAIAGVTQAAGDKQGGTIIYTKPLKAVTFSHDSHVGKQGLTCNLCHTRLFKMKALDVQEKADFTMAGLAEGKYCGACHNGNFSGEALHVHSSVVLRVLSEGEPTRYPRSRIWPGSHDDKGR